MEAFIPWAWRRVQVARRVPQIVHAFLRDHSGRIPIGRSALKPRVAGKLHASYGPQKPPITTREKGWPNVKHGCDGHRWGRLGILSRGTLTFAELSITPFSNAAHSGTLALLLSPP